MLKVYKLSVGVVCQGPAMMMCAMPTAGAHDVNYNIHDNNVLS
jgi:hypothetical protein